MRIFNAIQLVIMFIAWPYLIQYLHQADFDFVNAAFWSAVVLYFVQTIFTIAAYVKILEKE